VEQLGPSCEVHAYFHYIFTDEKRLYRYLKMDGWNRMVDQMLKDEEQTCIDITKNLDQFFHDVEWKDDLIYVIDKRMLKVYQMYPLLGKKSGVINMYYFNGKEGEDVYLKLFRRARKAKIFEDPSILEINNRWEQLGAASLNAIEGKRDIFNEEYMDQLEKKMEEEEGYDFGDALRGHSTTYTREHIIDSNGVVIKVPTNLVYSFDTVISCIRWYCEPLIEIKETPPEMKFMDRIYDNMVKALSEGEFTPGLVKEIITTGEMDRVKSRVTEDTEPIPMQPLE